MKKFLTKMIPLTLLVLALCMSSIAASANTVTLADPTYKDGTATVSVTSESNGQVVVLVVDGDRNEQYLANTAAATLQSQIIYVDQASATAGNAVTFNFLENDAAVDANNKATVYASGTDASVVVKPLTLENAAVVSTVTLNANGGTIVSGNVTEYTEGTATTLPANVTKTGYEFAGWFEDAGFAGVAVEAIPTTATGNKTYYAKWNFVIGNITVDDDTTGADAGYYKDAEDATKYAISVTAKVNTNVLADIAKYGFVVYKDSALDVDASTLGPQEQLDANGYYTIAYGIPETETALATDICFKPFVVTANGEVVYGAVQNYCVDDFEEAATKYLGTAAELGFTK